MRKRNIAFAGMATGAFVGLLMMVITHIPLGNDSDGDKITIMYHWSGALLTLIGIPLMSAFLVKYGSEKMNGCEPSLKQLIPVAYLTFLIPVLGASFGAPNSDLDTLATLILMGMIGGLFWSSPFAIWNFYKGRDNNSVTDERDNITQNIVIQDSVVMGNVANIANNEE